MLIHDTFWTLWGQNNDRLYYCCIKWLGNADDAEDALSQAMLKAQQKTNNHRIEGKKMKAWLYKLTYHVCMDIRKKRDRKMEYRDPWELLTYQKEQNPVLLAQQEELEKFFDLCIDELPPRLKETFILHFKEELSYREIAEKLKISHDNVRKRISQTRIILNRNWPSRIIRGN
ncbi:RNA polymerase sigma factor [Anabaena sp. FACHB-1237]|uniref:RNA polymerase sigma factor n=1 Tax=Anabaena sp. FACHB-1237 TaxID=2692769 RepID=UPI00167FE4EF|nr:RNA polymerase sigma factor [Anabaena sp. FACHB-1237]MBD2139477.1 RNA polymerase sigma factor [Anabaena sp. FACHB-1237]